MADGSNLYSPKVSLGDVVLPEELKATILADVQNHAKFVDYKDRTGLGATMPHSTGLVILFHGPSGTGKTMTVNAVAAKLQKRVLLVNLPAMMSGQSSERSSFSYQILFREADMSNAVLFFDEVRPPDILTSPQAPCHTWAHPASLLL